MKSVIFLFFLFSAVVSYAQQDEVRPSWEFEIDPIAYALKGGSVHVIYQPNKFRYDLGLFAIEQPEAFHGNKGFLVKTRGVGAKVNYIPFGVRGLFTGVGAGYIFNEATHSSSEVSDHGQYLGFGIHAGYRLFLSKAKEGVSKGFYLAPWASIDYNFALEPVSFKELKFKTTPFSFFPTIHIGYRL